MLEQDVLGVDEDMNTKRPQIYRFSLRRAAPTLGSAHLPFRLSVEESAGRMDVDHLLVDQGPVTLLRVFLGGVSKESTADGLLHTDCGLTTRDHIQLVSVRKINPEKAKMGGSFVFKGSVFQNDGI